MNKKTPPDIKNREKIARELGKSFFVEAGAGSGKTHSLIERMTALIISGEAEVENIAAITFTRKAAAELKERFQIRLERILASEETIPKEKERAKEALLHFDRAFLGTIHSFCGRLLRERSVEAGVDPDFREIEEEDNILYAEDSWNEYLEKASLKGTGEMERMIYLGIDPYGLKNIFIKRTGNTDVLTVMEECPQPDLSEEKRKVKEFIGKLSALMPGEEPSGGWDKLQSAVDRARRLIGMGYLEDNKKFIHLAWILSRKYDVVLKKWEDVHPDDVKKIAEDWISFQEEVVTSAIQRWGKYLHKPIMEFVGKGVEEYRKWREERSLLNFQDLLTRTADMLRENPEVRNYFKARVSRLLVDEFQDTDPIQAEIITLLSGQDNSENNWRRLTPKAGALFVVGDPKQSIYRFRRADMDTYNIVKDMFRKDGCQILALDANFRSLPVICASANKIFSDVFPPLATKYQAAFAPLLAMREDVPASKDEENTTSGIFISPIGKIKGNVPMIVAELDAEAIAGWIKWAISGGIKLRRSDSEKLAGRHETPVPADFMILTRAKARLYIYARALERMGIPYEVSGGESFCQSEELAEIYGIFRCLADPSDPRFLIAALRGQFFGISDKELYLFKRSGGKFSFVEPYEGSVAAVGEAYRRLRELRQLVLLHSPGMAAEKIVEALGIFPLAASREMGSTRAGNIVKALELLRSDSFLRGWSFSELTEKLGVFLSAKGKEEMGLFPAEANCVRVMNLHKAKGLEAGVVFLADPLGSGKEFEPDAHIVRTADVSMGYFTVTKPKSRSSNDADAFAFPPDWEKVSIEEKKYTDAERERLEYVAFTRARNILCVSVYTDKEGKKDPAWNIIEPGVTEERSLEPVKAERARKEKIKMEPGEWKKETERSLAAIEKLKTRSFEVTSVTRKAKEGMVFEKAAPTGRGRAWGNLVHKALEACGKGNRKDLPELLVNWMIEEDLDISGKDELLVLVDGIMKSDMWERVMRAEVKYFELPFSITDGNTVFSGAMDLVFKEKEGWVIVDYKTDDFNADPARKAAYDKQLDMYADFWEKLTGEKVKDKLLYRAA